MLLLKLFSFSTCWFCVLCYTSSVLPLIMWNAELYYNRLFISDSLYKEPGGHCYPGLVHWTYVCGCSSGAHLIDCLLHQEESRRKISRWGPHTSIAPFVLKSLMCAVEIFPHYTITSLWVIDAGRDGSMDPCGLHQIQTLQDPPKQGNIFLILFNLCFVWLQFPLFSRQDWYQMWSFASTCCTLWDVPLHTSVVTHGYLIYCHDPFT